MEEPRIALLRGVNLGGANRVAMADVRAALEAAGFSAVRSLLQSGNLVFQTERAENADIETRAEAALRERIGLKVEVVVRDPAAWQAMIAANPFPEVAETDPPPLDPVDLNTRPAPDAEAAMAAIPGREQARLIGREAIIWYPDGQADTKLAGAALDRALGARGTARNWNTVLKLAALVAP
jgi:uncharacterized protein (DUF1697 family)